MSMGRSSLLAHATPVITIIIIHKEKTMALYNTTTKQEFEEHALQSERPVLVDFWAPWCPPCRAMAPLLEQIAEETEFDVVKVDTEASQDNAALALQHQVQSIPNMKIFKSGAVVAELVGMKPTQELIDALQQADA